MSISSIIKNPELAKLANQSNLTFTSKMKSEISDEQLMLDYSKGDGLAFEILYKRHNNGLYRYCLRQFSSASIAQECFQDIWMKVISYRARYQSRALFTTYLYRIAQNNVIDIYRKEKKRIADCEFDEVTSAVWSHENAENNHAVSEKQQQVERLRREIAQLPFEQRNTLLLKLDADLSLQQIATILDCGKETVKSRLRYATNKLKEQFDVSLGVTSNE